MLAEGVSIGPACVVEGRVEIGEDTRLHRGVSLQGPLTIGRDNCFHSGACIGYPPQDRSFDPAREGAGTTIGDGNLFREGVTIHRATGDRPTAVGNRNTLMVHSHLAHDVRLGSGCTLGSGATLGGHAQIGDGVVFRPNGLVHQFCRVGRLAVIHSNGGPTQDAPPFCVVSALRRIGSLNHDGLERAGYGRHIAALQEAFDLLYFRRHTVRHAVELIEERLGDDPLCAELAAFIRASKRGIVGGGNKGRTEEKGTEDI